MRVGIVIPQGLEGQFAGWDPARAWDRMLAVAIRAEALGFDSIWVYDHLGTFGAPRDEPTFEAFLTLGALAQATRRVRLGPLVARAGLRNPALLAKMLSSLDVISGGRAELGLGAGSTGEDAQAFGYDLPARQRMERLRETLEVVTRLLSDGRGTYAGAAFRIDDAINNPRGVQAPRVPIVVGGNGPTTVRLAVRFADGLNLDGLSPSAVPAALSNLRALLDEEGRSPTSLAISLLVSSQDLVAAGDARSQPPGRLSRGRAGPSHAAAAGCRVRRRRVGPAGARCQIGRRCDGTVEWAGSAASHGIALGVVPAGRGQLGGPESGFSSPGRSAVRGASRRADLAADHRLGPAADGTRGRGACRLRRPPRSPGPPRRAATGTSPAGPR